MVLYLNCGEIPMHKAQAYSDEIRDNLQHQYPSAKILVIQVRDNQPTRVEIVKVPVMQQIKDIIHRSLHK